MQPFEVLVKSCWARKAIRQMRDQEIDRKMDGMPTGFKACFVKKA
jgi:hypothetical protein